MYQQHIFDTHYRHQVDDHSHFDLAIVVELHLLTYTSPSLDEMPSKAGTMLPNTASNASGLVNRQNDDTAGLIDKNNPPIASYSSFAATAAVSNDAPTDAPSSDDSDDDNDKSVDLMMTLSEAIRKKHHRRRRPGDSLARNRFRKSHNTASDKRGGGGGGGDDDDNNNTLIGPYECAVTTSVLIYWVFVSLIPVYNKFFFQKSLFPYPVATAGIQLALVSFVLGLLNTIQHFLWKCNFGMRRREDQPVTKSYVFGPHFLWKMKWCFPIGFLFGVKYGVTNLGLHLVSAPTHLLLQSTDLVWTVLGAWWINGEVINCVEVICLLGCVAGSLVLGWQVSEDTSITAPLFAILINLISPIMLGLCIATLRLACVELMRPDNRVGGTVSSVELTCIKLMMSSSVALILACALEGGGHDQDNWDDENQQTPWWTAWAALPTSTKLGVLGGAVLIAVFQANCTFLTFLTNAVAVGLVGQVKIIPQWIVATIFATKTTSFSPKPSALLGAFLICGSAAAFAVSNWRHWREEEALESEFVDGDLPLLENLEEDRDGENARVRRSSSGGSFHSSGRDGKHHRPHLYTDADQWGDASIRSAFSHMSEKPRREGEVVQPNH
jgi:hypothetical protein